MKIISMEEAAKPQSIGSSLPVPYVQELAKQPLSAIPPRYVRPDQDPQFECNLNLSLEIPIIDLSKLLSGDHSELENLHSACNDWGFFQLINHGVSSSLIEKVKHEIPEFFKLPMEEKKKYRQHPEDVEGYGQNFVMSEETKLDWSDMFLMVTQPTYMRKPHLFPELPLSLRDTLETYSTELRNLTQKVLDQLGKTLRMDPNYMKELFEGGLQAIQMNYYPPCPHPELVSGNTSHFDSSALTIVLQINEVDGLQVKKDGTWVPVKPLPNAFIINVGNGLEIVTNGIYPSVEHRVTVNAKKERLSIVVFCNVKPNGYLGPAPSLISQETPAMFRKIGIEDYLKGYFAREQRGKYIDILRIQNADSKSF